MKTSLKIRLLRHSILHDQQQMAEKLNMTVAEYSRIETGLTSIEGSNLDKLTKIFGLTVKQFNAKKIPVTAFI